MIKTLRITGVLAAILAGVLIYYFVLPMVYDVGGRKRAEKAPPPLGVIDRFKQEKGTHTKGAGNQTSPLVKQATAYARYLSPKRPVDRPPPVGGATTTTIALGPTTPKFPVFVTAYFESNPALSQALIDEPGKGRHWVRQGSMVGHLLIEQVKDGAVVVKSSKETFELEVEKAAKTSPPKGRSPISRGTTGTSSSSRSLPTPSRTGTRSARTLPSRTPSKAPQSNNAAADKDTEKFIDKLRDLQSSRTPADQARIDQLISKFRSTRVSVEDAKNLTKLGDKVKNGQKDPNQASPTSKTGKIEKSLAKPDASTSK